MYWNYLCVPYAHQLVNHDYILNIIIIFQITQPYQRYKNMHFTQLI